MGQEDPLGEGNGNPLPYSCTGSSMDREAWWAACSPWVTKESDITQRLNTLYISSGSMYRYIVEQLSPSSISQIFHLPTETLFRLSD